MQLPTVYFKSLLSFYLLCQVACSPSLPTRDDIPPRPISVIPKAYYVLPETIFQVNFSETIYVGRKPEKNVKVYKLISPFDLAFIDEIIDADVSFNATYSGFIIEPLNDLPPGAYAIFVNESLIDADGNPMVDNEGYRTSFQYFFEVKNSHGDEPALVSSSEFDEDLPISINIKSLAGEKNAQLTLESSKQVSLDLWYGEKDLSCNSVSCPLHFDYSAGQEVVSAGKRLWVYKLSLAKLSFPKKYKVIVAAKAKSDETKYYRGSFQTAKLPKLVLNEIMFNPWVKYPDKESQAEYIELINIDDSAISPGEFSIRVYSKDGKKQRTCSLKRGVGKKDLLPGEQILIVSSHFEDDYYDFYDDTNFWKLRRKTICGVLPNNAGHRIELVDSMGRVISSYGGYLEKLSEGRSVERVQPDAVDKLGNFCYSRLALGPTPGRKNGVTLRGCD